MRRQKSGFTLIELLAVIVILAVIAMITVPLILNRISEIEKEAFRDNVFAITKAISTNKINDETNQVKFTEEDDLKFKNKNGIEFDATYVADELRYTFLGNEKYMIDITKCQLSNPDLLLRGKYCSMEEILTLSSLIIPRGDRPGSYIVSATTDLTPGTLSGGGLVNDPYLIESIEDLVAFSQSVNAGNTYVSKYIRLALSLDFKNYKSYINSNTTAFGDVNGDSLVEGLKRELSKSGGFIPIGTSTANFRGYFYGDLNTIYNLLINRPTVDNVGLFGYIYNATVTGLSLTNASVIGRNNVALLVGNIYSYSSNTLFVSENNISGNVTGTDNVGLVAGNFYTYVGSGKITSIIAEGNVTGNNAVGGLVGSANGLPSDNIISGIMKGGSVTSVGSSVGRIYGVADSSFFRSSLAVSGVTVNGATVSSGNYAGSHGTDITSIADINDINVSEMALDTYIGGDNDGNGIYWDYEGTSVVQKRTSTSPITFTLSGAGTTASPYLIANSSDLKQASTRLSSVYKLTSNINMSGLKHYTLGSYLNRFTGKFDGDLNTIDNLTINSPLASNVGFVGYMYNATITGLNLTNASVIGRNNVALLVGNIYSYSSNTLFVSENNISGNVTGTDNVGLVAGNFYTYAGSGKITSVIAEGNVTGNNAVGGLVGSANGLPSDNIISGIMKGGSVTSVGSSVGRIFGVADSSFFRSSLAVSGVTVNGANVSSASYTGNNGYDIPNMASINDLNIAEIALDTYIGGDNDGNGIYWDYEGTSVVQKRTSTSPITFTLSGAGTIASPYLITNSSDLKQVSARLASTYKLTSNIDMSGLKHYVIGAYTNRFTGKIYGSGNTISNLSVNSPLASNIGFVGYMYNATVQGLILKNATIVGRNNVGGLVGYVYSYSTPAAIVSDNIVEANVTGNDNVGLATGYLYSYVSPLRLTSIVAEGNVSGNNYVGSLFGSASGSSGSGVVNGVVKGGTVSSVGTSAGRIYGTYSSSYTQSNSALSDITVNGSTVAGVATDKNGLTITNTDLTLNTTYVDRGFNFTNEALDYIWYMDASVAKFREGNL